MDTLHITMTVHDGISIVHLSGEIDASSTRMLDEQLLPIARRAERMILDVGSVRAISSVGLREILMVYRTVKSHGGQMLITSLSDTLRNVMWATGFLNYFIVAESVEVGLAVYAGQS
jgi:anti-sigma B factor antagonist